MVLEEALGEPRSGRAPDALEATAAGPGAELVSVVIPAYNAEDTLDETLHSARRQSHAKLEILVVDDGSTDGTGRIAHAHAAEDPRVRVVTVPNGGVAAARNAGFARARGDLIAPLDADDLWHPEKIALQIAEMRRGGPSMGFVYTGFRRIDPAGRILGDGIFYEISGRGFLRAIFLNFVGNGSALLLRRAALDEVGGYEPQLHALGVQGAEDRLLQVRVARNWEVGVVREYATGYRQRPDAMSRDNLRMLKSQFEVLDMVARHYPETPAWVLSCTRAMFEVRLAVELTRRRRPGAAARALGRAFARSPRTAWAESLIQAPQIASKIARAVLRRTGLPNRATGLHFYDVPPKPVRRRVPGRHRRLMERLAAAEGAVPVPESPAERRREGAGNPSRESAATRLGTSATGAS